MNSKIRIILTKLNKNYSLPHNWFRASEPLEQLIITLLSQNTTWKNTLRAYINLKKKFPSLEKLGQGKLRDVKLAIRSAGLYHQKARRIREILKIIKQREGNFSLLRLKKLNLDQALKYLLNLPGVGEKTARCVLLFSLNKKVLPVDTHILRLSKRLGIIPEDSDTKDAHKILSRIIPPEEYLNFHIKMIQHGREICRALYPKCENCFLSKLCNYIR